MSLTSHDLPELRKMLKDPDLDDHARTMARIFIAGLTGKGVRLTPDETYDMSRDEMLASFIHQHRKEEESP